MINDLDVTGSDLWKYVDDITISESTPKHESSKIQTSVDELTRNSTADKFQLNQAKCKELRITFAKTVRCFAPVYVNGLPIEVVPCAKILGLRISNDLIWNAHISEKDFNKTVLPLPINTSKTIHPSDLLTFYKTCVRPVMEYACPVFYDSLPINLSEELQKLQIETSLSYHISNIIVCRSSC